MIQAGGYVPMSTTDWPDQLAAVVFVQGCPWRCHYCHNPGLQPRCAGSSAQHWPDLLAKLRKRQGLLDGVVFSGGEPTLDPALGEAMQEVRALGFKVGLHTAGIYPDRLNEVLPWVDWVGFDVKTQFDDYATVTGIPRSGTPAWHSLMSVIQAGIPFEVRTTYHPDLHPDQTLLDLALCLKQLGVQQWVLQGFRPTAGTPESLGTRHRPIPAPLIQQLKDTLADSATLVSVR